MSPPQIQHVAPDEVFALLGSRSDGLAEREAEARLAEIGPNVLRAERRGRWLATLARQFTNFFSLLLDMAAIACFVADRMQPGEGMFVLGWALVAVALLNGLFAFAQEYRAELAMAALQKFLPPRAIVRRQGTEGEILAERIVPGDVLLVREGDRIPADARVVAASDLLVSNAPLTGESRSVAIGPAATGASLLESPNLLFSGCSIVRGTATAVVFATGGRTEFGKIAALSRDIRRPTTPLERETRRMVRILTGVAVTMGLVFFVYGVLSGQSLWVNLVFMLGIIVANVPEGLLPTLTLALSMGSLRLARKNVLVKSLPAIETLGAIHVICSDKTGTLTENRLEIRALVDAQTGEPLEGDEVRYSAGLRLALIASEVERREGGFGGDPLDVVIAQTLATRGEDVPAILSRVERRFSFDVAKRREAGLFHDGDERLFAVKGAWESLRPLIGSVASQSSIAMSADATALERADAVVHRLAAAGSRVIAIASRRLDAADGDGSRETLERELTLFGFLALDDPLRPEARPAIAHCHRAGIDVVMITGDHPDTAEAVARRLGILPDERSASVGVMTGGELDRIREQDLVGRLEAGLVVFARTNPEQKMKIVGGLKRMGKVVGMTGDGVNDAPALKAADVGIAMGASGTDVAREAADIVLLDDNFASIAAGVEEGRAIFDNIRKFTNYVLTSNGPEIIPYLLYIVLPIPLALSIIQILSIDLGTDILPAIGLGQEPPERATMERPPRRLDARLLDARLLAHSYLFLGMIQAGYSLLLFFTVLVQGGWRFGQRLPGSDPLVASASGLALATIILMQIGNLVGRRSSVRSGFDGGLFTNPLFAIGVLVEIAFSWGILYARPLQDVLGTGPVSPAMYALAWLGAPLMFGVDYFFKQRFFHPRGTR